MDNKDFDRITYIYIGILLLGYVAFIVTLYLEH